MAIVINPDKNIKEYNLIVPVGIDHIASFIGCNKDDVVIDSTEIFVYAYYSVDNYLKDDKLFNPVASTLIGDTLYGNIIVLSGKELSDELNEYKTDLNSVFDSSQFNMAILKMYEIMTAAEKNKECIYFDFDKIYEAYLNGQNKSEYDDENEEGEEEEQQKSKPKKKKILESEFKTVIELCYLSLKNANTIDPKDFVLIDSGLTSVNIKLNPSKVNETIGSLIWYFETQEQYEKCAVLRDIKSKIKKY